MNFDFAEFRQFLEASPELIYVVQSKCYCPVARWLAIKLGKQIKKVEVDDCKVVLDGVHYPVPMWMSVYIRRFDKLADTGHHRAASDAMTVANELAQEGVWHA